MTKVYNDMFIAADSGQVTALCLLDVMMAFDTVSHDLLMHCLEDSIWYSRCCSQVVSFILARQIIPCL